MNDFLQQIGGSIIGQTITGVEDTATQAFYTIVALMAATLLVTILILWRVWGGV